jgi:predicted ATPase
LGPADYLTIAAQFHTLIVEDIPILPLSAKNQARRFISLIDALYESKVKLVCLAAAPQDDLFFPEAAQMNLEGDSLEEEALSETIMEPYRPNVSVYSEKLPEPSTADVPRRASGEGSWLGTRSTRRRTSRRSRTFPSSRVRLASSKVKGETEREPRTRRALRLPPRRLAHP